MPIFEFICSECGQSFEELVRGNSLVEEVICPACGGDQVKKQLSMFASRVVGTSAVNSISSSANSCNTGST